MVKTPAARIRFMHNIPDPYLRQMGWIVVRWSNLETLVDWAIGHLLRVSAGGHAAVTIGLMLPFRLDMLRGLVQTHIRVGAVRREIESIIDGILKVQPHRNFVVHGSWMGVGDDDKDAGLMGYTGKQNKLGYRQELWLLEDFEHVTDEIADLEARLMAWVLTKPKRTLRAAWHERHLPQFQRSRRKGARAPQRAILRRPQRPSWG